MTLDHPLLQRLHAYWDGKRNGRVYPGREVIDPLELRFMLGNLILLDVEPEPLRFRYRLFGTEIARRPKNEILTDGIVGFRVNHNLDVHIEPAAS